MMNKVSFVLHFFSQKSYFFFLFKHDLQSYHLHLIKAPLKSTETVPDLDMFDIIFANISEVLVQLLPIRTGAVKGLVLEKSGRSFRILGSWH